MADPKPEPRVSDPELLRCLHRRWRECAVCGTSSGRLSLHHIRKHPRDDVEGNLVMLCGSGTTGCHGAVEAHDEKTLRRLRDHIECCRADTIDYLDWRLGGLDRATDWLDRMAA
jgi:hypothetical protein